MSLETLVLSRRAPVLLAALALSAGLLWADQRVAAAEKKIAPTRRAATDDAELTVATYNVNWGEVNLRETAAVIGRAKADLVVLQETTPRIEAFLRRALVREYPFMAFRGYRGRYGAERFGILARSPVENLRFLPPKHGLFGALVGQWHWHGRQIQIVNVHLQPPLLGSVQGPLDWLKAFQEMEQVHGQEIATVYENLADGKPTLVMGDFNSMSGFAAPSFLVQKGLVDSFAAVHENPAEHPTWRWRIRNVTCSGRIDYIFHTAEFRTAESRVEKSTASDHHLVVSRLRWREPADTKQAATDRP